MPAHRWLLLSFLVWLAGMHSACCPRYVADVPENMVLVPAGWFWMGESGGLPASRPGHWVYLNGFAIDQTEVTDQAFEAFLEARSDQAAIQARDGYSRQDNEPAVGVNWEYARAYCQWLGKKLPSEAEWEKAARGRDGRRYPWGDVWRPDLANTVETRSGKVQPVGSYPGGASAYGALDMCGNAGEWVTDYFSPIYYSFIPTYNPQGPVEILDHGLRGGSWDSPKEQATTFFRDSSHSVLPNLRVGFRCAMSLDD